MSIKHTSAVWLLLLLLGMLSATLAIAEPDSGYSDSSDMFDDNGEQKAESFDIEKVPGYVTARDYTKDVARDLDKNLYPKPQVPTPYVGDSLKTCVALDDEIVALSPLTYRTVPGFYDDPNNAAIIWLATTEVSFFNILPDEIPLTEIPLGYAFLAYPAYKKYKEEERIRRASLHIESLRRAKARKRCFET